MRCGLVQMTSSDQPDDNLWAARDLVERAVADGAGTVLTPEVTNCISTSRTHQRAVLTDEASDPVLDGLRDVAAKRGIWLLIGSLALKVEGEDRLANRSFLIGPDGTVTARYDKIHMFDVAISQAETYRESDAFRPGDAAVVADAGDARMGLSVCYDVRFGYLYRALAQAGAQILTVPAAFAVATGRAHWETLLRARAIETGCFVLAPAQCGDHAISRGRARQTWGHSLAVAPWGEVLADGGDAPGVTCVDIDLSAVQAARGRVPSLTHDRGFDGP